MGSGCGSVGRASDTRGLQFESSHRQKIIYIEHLFTVNCVLKRQKLRKRGGEWPIFTKGAAAIALWFHLHPPSWAPGSNPKHTIYAFYNLYN